MAFSLAAASASASLAAVILAFRSACAAACFACAFCAAAALAMASLSGPLIFGFLLGLGVSADAAAGRDTGGFTLPVVPAGLDPPAAVPAGFVPVPVGLPVQSVFTAEIGDPALRRHPGSAQKNDTLRPGDHLPECVHLLRLCQAVKVFVLFFF